MRLQPVHRVGAAVDQRVRTSCGSAAIIGDARDVVEILRARIAAEIRARALRRAQPAHQRVDIVDVGVDRAHRAVGKSRVAAALVDRSAFEHDDGCAVVARRQRCRQPCQPGTNHDHVRGKLTRRAVCHVSPPQSPVAVTLQSQPCGASSDRRMLVERVRLRQLARGMVECAISGKLKCHGKRKLDGSMPARASAGDLGFIYTCAKWGGSGLRPRGFAFNLPTCTQSHANLLVF